MKKFLAQILILVMIFSSLATFTLADESKYFSDVSARDYFSTAANSLYEAGIVKGYDDNTFGPKKYVTRAEMVTFVCRAMGKEEAANRQKGYTTDFSKDVKSNHWASGYVWYAVSQDIISGDGNGLFRPEDPVKYEEAVKMIVCAIGLDSKLKANPDDWAAPYLEAADKHGFTKNYVESTRGDYVNRADVAVLLFGAIEDKLHSITFDTTYEGDSNFDEINRLQLEGSVIPLKFTPQDGYDFVRWSSAGLGKFAFTDSTTTQFTMPAKDVHITPVCKRSSTSTNRPQTDTNKPQSGTNKPQTNTNNNQSSSNSGSKTWNDYMSNPHNFYNVFEDDDYDPESNEWMDFSDYSTYQLTVKMVGCGGIRMTSGKYSAGSYVPIYVYPGTEKDFLMWISTNGRVIWPDDPTSIIIMPDEDIEVCAVFREADGSLPNIPGFKEKYNAFIRGIKNAKDDYDDDSSSSYEDEDDSEDYIEEDFESIVSQLEDEVIRLVNEERAKAGLGKLSKDNLLIKVAEDHSEDMCSRNFFNHKNPDGESPFDRMKRNGIKYKTAGENIAKGQKTAEAVMKAWMNSEGHRANILNPDFTHIGVGVSVRSGTYYWTQCFIG